MSAMARDLQTTCKVVQPLATVRSTLRRIVRCCLVAWLNSPAGRVRPTTRADLARLRARLHPGDVILVAGHTRFARLVQRLSGCHWSHVAVYTGPISEADPTLCVVEADVEYGVRAIALAELQDLELRIVRPVGLDDDARLRLVAHLRSRIGHAYDLEHAIAIARVLLPLPAWLRRGLRRLNPAVLSSGDPTKAICSTLLAHAFLSVGLPIAPTVRLPEQDEQTIAVDDPLRIAALCTPRDFALSPRFAPLEDDIAQIVAQQSQRLLAPPPPAQLHAQQRSS